MEKPKKLSKNILDPGFLKIKIPEREGNKIISPLLWYVIYEANIRKPRILNMSFRDEYHGKKFCLEYLKDVSYNVLIGKDLIAFGILKVQNKLSEVSHRTKGNNSKYFFDINLNPKKRKTLRTMYRRTLRRNLITLLNRKNGNIRL